MNQNFQVPGYEDMELSTQILIGEALRRGVEVEILDRIDSFIRLKKGSHIEYVKEASKTAKDSYMTFLLMENKQTSKQLLSEVGIPVPQGRSYTQLGQALQDLPNLNFQKIVIKPKSTNFGLGISILSVKDPRIPDAMEKAFSYGTTILVEEFVEGIECRFLVIDGHCSAVLHRVPANVLGDGHSSIQTLVDLKNADPRRGKGYKTPLEKIELGDFEKAVLFSQGLQPESIPALNQNIFLRENSNISTGGDSLDYTDHVHEEYKRLAERAAQSVEAKLCGVDIILKNPLGDPALNLHAVLELNFNPVLYFHNFPYEGENRHVEKAVMDLLGF